MGLGARRGRPCRRRGGTGPPPCGGLHQRRDRKAEAGQHDPAGKQGAARAPQSPMFRRHRGQFAAESPPSSISSPRKRRPWTTVVVAGRIGDRQGAGGPGPSTTAAPGISSPLWRSTAGPSRKASLKASCSVHKKGAFAGAETADKKGYLDQADGGTLLPRRTG